MDPQVGVSVIAQGNFPNAGPSFTVNSALLDLKVDDVFRTFTMVTGGASNVPIGKFKMKAFGENLKISSFTFTPQLNGTTGGLCNLMLYFNGSQVGTIQNWESGNVTFHVGSQCKLTAGEEYTVELRADTYRLDGHSHTSGYVGINIPAEGIVAQGLTTMLFIKNKEVKGPVLAFGK